ncbi:hypothetical protein YQE_02988, partial [Dendroctonus ponderosae]
MWYLIVTDYYSRFFQIFKLIRMSEAVIIEKLKQLFCRYGLPEIVRSDNGPQFQSEFKTFSREYDFKHITSSPYFAQSNGCVEAAVKTAKSLLKKNDDIYRALLAYRTTSLECGFSPSELMFGRKIRSFIPLLPITDYYSRFFEIFKLIRMSEAVIIEKLKQLFCRYGLPEIVRSDNGPQFQSEFKTFSREYDFKHITSSPYFAQSNGCVEAAVKTAKSLLKKNDDIYRALLAYRTTSLECGFSPSELMFGRKIRSFIPLLPSQLNTPTNTQSLADRESQAKERSSKQYNNRHRSRKLSDLGVGDYVWVTDLRVYAKVVQILDEPRSYLIESNSGIFRRNRWHLIPAPYYTQRQFTPTYTSLDNDPSGNYCNNDSFKITESAK